jgi:hypothetical protein
LAWSTDILWKNVANWHLPVDMKFAKSLAPAFPMTGGNEFENFWTDGLVPEIRYITILTSFLEVSWHKN